MNNVQIVLRCRKLRKRPPKKLLGKCPVCGSDDITTQADNGQTFDYDRETDTTDVYFDCEKCRAQFTVVFSIKHVIIENVCDENNNVIWR